jgi:AraC-like DNA-binding protein
MERVDALGSQRRAVDGERVPYCSFAEILYSADGLLLGVTRLSDDMVGWSKEMAIGAHHHLVFPYSAQLVGYERAGETVVSSNELVFHPARQRYRRQKMYEGKERTIYLGLDSEHVQVAGIDDALIDGPATITRLTCALSLSALQLANDLSQCALTRRSDLEYTERALSLVRDCSRYLPGRAYESEASKPSTRRSRKRLVDVTREYLAASFSESSLPLAQVAAEVGSSPFHLARVFRTTTGYSLHEYRTQLRVRAVLAHLGTEHTLTDLAMMYGFASPGHLSALFHNTFAQSPSTMRSESKAVLSNIA